MTINWVIETPATEDAMRHLADEMAAHYDGLTVDEACQTIVEAVAVERGEWAA